MIIIIDDNVDINDNDKYFESLQLAPQPSRLT